MVKSADSPSPGPHGPPTAVPSPTTTTTTTNVPVPPGGDDTLPKTGLDTVVLVLIAVALILVGAATMALLTRDRRGHI